MRNLVTGILVVSITVVGGCNPFLDRVKETGVDGPSLHRCGDIDGGLDKAYVSLA